MSARTEGKQAKVTADKPAEEADSHIVYLFGKLLSLRRTAPSHDCPPDVMVHWMETHDRLEELILSLPPQGPFDASIKQILKWGTQPLMTVVTADKPLTAKQMASACKEALKLAKRPRKPSRGVKGFVARGRGRRLPGGAS